MSQKINFGTSKKYKIGLLYVFEYFQISCSPLSVRPETFKTVQYGLFQFSDGSVRASSDLKCIQNNDDRELLSFALTGVNILN